MKGTYKHLMTVDELFQALFQDKSFFTEHNITHIRSAYLYFTPCDAAGETVTIRDKTGREVDGYISAGCYRSAADNYENASNVEPLATARTVTTGGRRKKGGPKPRPKP